MSGAIRLQQPRAFRARRLVAAVTGLWLLAFGVLGARHESRVAHYADGQTGQVHHGWRSDCRNRTGQSHIHSAKAENDHGVCEIATVLHQAARPSASPPVVMPALATAGVELATAHAVGHTVDRVYRLAPKTSPPSAS
jgi:hypothetical protein